MPLRSVALMVPFSCQAATAGRCQAAAAVGGRRCSNMPINISVSGNFPGSIAVNGSSFTLDDGANRASGPSAPVPVTAEQLAGLLTQFGMSVDDAQLKDATFVINGVRYTVR